MNTLDNPNLSREPLLTIAIPTYNRAAYLDFCLKCISDEVDGLSEHLRRLVNIYISDNASTDNTQDVIAGYRQIKVNQFDVMRNASNIGGNPNINQCYKSATTPYVWILGDDDAILPGGLKLVLNSILKKDVDVISVGAYGYDNDYLKTPITRRRKDKTLVLDNAVEFARRTHSGLAFLSTIIIRTGISTENYTDILVNSLLSQFVWVLQLLRDGHRFAVIENWVIAAKRNNTGGYGQAEVFGIDLQKVTNHILKNRPDLIKTIQNGIIVNFFPAAIINGFRNKDTKFKESDFDVKLAQSFGKNWRYRVFLLPLMTLPKPLARFYFILIAVITPFFYAWLI